MNDQSYIRKAVELADGWEITGDDVPMLRSQNYQDALAYAPDELIDALAAQLVRQVDALDRNQISHLDIANDRTCIWAPGKKPGIYRCKSTDRTMNTIKAIVDSKVLAGSS